MPDPSIRTGSPQKPPQNIDFTARLKKRRRTSATTELDEYLHITNTPAKPWETDPLQWWFVHRERFPIYRLVRDVFSIPGMSSLFVVLPSILSVTVKHILSGGRDAIGRRRASLQLENIYTLKARLRMTGHETAVVELLGEDGKGLDSLV